MPNTELEQIEYSDPEPEVNVSPEAESPHKKNSLWTIGPAERLQVHFTLQPGEQNTENSTGKKRVLKNRQLFQTILSSIFEEQNLPPPQYQSNEKKRQATNMFQGPMIQNSQNLQAILPDIFQRENPSLNQFIPEGKSFSEFQKPLIVFEFGYIYQGIAVQESMITMQNVKPEMVPVLARMINEAILRFRNSVRGARPKANNLNKIATTLRQKREQKAQNETRKVYEKKLGNRGFGDPYAINYFMSFVGKPTASKGGKRKTRSRRNNRKNKTARR